MNKKIIMVVMALVLALTFASCGTVSNDEGNSSTQTTETASQESTKTVDQLLEEENELFASHSEQWDKLFANADKDSLMNNSEDFDYGKYLSEQIEALKDQFSEEDLKILNADLERIVEIEAEIKKLDAK